MKKSLVITATFMMACIAAKGSLNVKTVRYDNLLVQPNINSNDSQNFWQFYTVRLIVNIIDINGTVINNEYCYGEPGTYTGLSQFYDPNGYELVGATDNGVKLDKIQAENLIVPEFLGNSSETIDYIVRPIKKESKDKTSKSKDEISTKNKIKSTDTKQSNDPNVKNDTSNNEANKNKKIENDKDNKNKKVENDKDKNNENKINNGTTKKKSSNTKSLINSKNKEDKNNNNSKSDSNTLNHNNGLNELQSQDSETGFGLSGKANSDKSNKYPQNIDQPKSNYAELVKSKMKKTIKIINENNEPINSSVTKNKSLIPYSPKDIKKIKVENSTHNSQNLTKKNPNLTVSSIVEVPIERESRELNNLKSKDGSPDNKKHMFKFEMPVVSMCVTDDSNDVPNSKMQHSDIDKKSSFNINTTYIKSKGLLIITALMGIVSALSLAIKPKK